MKLACIASLTALFGKQAWSQEFIWTDGTGTNLWNTSANWNPAGVPNVAGESAVLNAGPVILDTNVAIDSLMVGPAVDLTVNSGLSLNFSGTVPAHLTNRGTITTETRTDFQFRGAVENSGSIILTGGSAPATAADIELAGDTVLSGGGTITLTGTYARFNGNATPTATLTISNQSIRGTGFVGANSINIVNNAGNVIDANVDGKELSVGVVDLFTNRGILQASQGGILTFPRSRIDNSSGIIRALEASTVELGLLGFAAAHISGGTLRSSGSGLLQNSGGTTTTFVTLEDVTIQGRFVKGNNSTTTIEGNLANEGTITLNSGPTPATGSTLRMRGSPTIAGGGTVILNGPHARINGEANARPTFLNQTIEGSGEIDSSLKPVFGLGSSVNANVPGGTLTVQIDPATPVISHGSFRVSLGSTLQISDANKTGVFTNGGQISLSSGLGAEAVGKLSVRGNTTLNGGGKIVMEGPFTRIEGDAGAQPVVADQTIEGSGQIAPSFAPTWGAKSTVHANRAGETLGIQFDHTKPLVSLGTFRVNPGSTLNLFPTPGAVTRTQITHSGQLIANGTVSAPGSLFSYTKGSRITGFGFIQSKGFFNNGFLSPGASPGTLTLTMETASDIVELGPDAVLALEIGGTTPGTEHDVLDVQGGLNLGGALQVFLLGFQPDPADVFTVVTQSEGFGALSGTFDGIADGETVRTEDGGGTFAVNYQTAAVTLSGFSLTPFGAWKEANLGTDAFDPLIGHPVLGDPNGNGTSLLLEYAFFMDPLAGNDEDKLPKAATAMDGGVAYPAISFRRLTGAAHGLIYSVWESTDLVGWTQLDLATHLMETVDHGDGSETITVRGTTPHSGVESTERTFLQVRVTLQA